LKGGSKGKLLPGREEKTMRTRGACKLVNVHGALEKGKD